jgi:hypothetical protein
MAKDNRTIHRGIRVMVVDGEKKMRDGRPQRKSVTFTVGMEDELAAQFNNTQLKAMIARGDLSGDWKSTKK